MSIRVLTDEETRRARAGATDLDLFEADRGKPDLAAALDTEAADVGRFDGIG